MTCTTTEPTVFQYVENDNLPAMSFVYKDKNGDPVPITGFSFSLHIEFEAGVTSVPGTITDADAGTFEFVFSDGDLSPSGTYNAEVEITNASSQKLTIQNIQLEISPEIGP